MSEAAPNEFPEDEQTVPAQNNRSLGWQLASEREAKGWTIEYVASQLNLAARQIHALEQENYAALPGMASVRGFVRAYAKLLKIDANPLVALIASEQIAPNLPLEPRPKLSSTPFSDSRLSGPGQRSTSVKGILIAVVFVLLALAIVGVEHFGGWPTLAESLSNQLKDMSSSAAPGSMSPSVSQDAASAAGDAKPAADTPDAAAKDSSQPVVAAPQVAAPLPQTAAPVDTPAVAAPAASAGTPAAVMPSGAPVTAPVVTAMPKPKLESVAQSDVAHLASAGKKPLQLTARQNSWVEVREGSNVLMARLLKAGETENLEVASSASLVVGNAAGVDVVYAGRAVPTNTDPKTNVARISFNSLK